MSKDSWYFNRLGKIAPVSNAGSGVPNYGLTVDAGLAPWDDQADFNSLVQDIPILSGQYYGGATTAASGAALRQAQQQPATSKQELGETQEASLWNHFTDLTHAAVGIGEAAIGAVYSGFDALPGTELNDETKKALKGKEGFDRLKALGGAGITGAAESPGIDKTLEGISFLTNKASQYGAAFFIAADDPRYRDMAIGEGFAAANKYVKRANLNVGQGFMQLLYDDEILDDKKRMEDLRRNSSVYNFGALAFNTIAGWKADPTVLIGRGLGGVRNSALTVGNVDLGRAAFSNDPKIAGLQREIVATGHEKGRAAAEQIARSQTGLANRVRANNALNMFDRSLELRKAAQDMPLSEFMNLPSFQRSGAGSVMASVMHEVAGSEDEWSLVFRSAIGDPTALSSLLTSRGEIATKIKAIEFDALGAKDEFQRVLDRYNTRASETGKGNKLDLTDGTNWLLDTEKTVAQARVNRLQAQLDTFRSKENWLDRATRGADSGEQLDSFFGSLSSLSAGKGLLQDIKGEVAPKFYNMAGKVSPFQHDAFGPLVRFAKAPALPFLKRYTHVDLHDHEGGLQTVQHSLDQFAHVMGKDDLELRNHILDQYGKAATDVSRNNLLAHMHLSLFRSLGSKYGLDPELMDQFGKEVLDRRGQAWAKMSEQDRWMSFAGESGASRKVLPIVDDNESGMTLMDSPMSVTDLPNHFPMMNWLDLDHTLRVNRDLIQELGTFHKNALAGRRNAEFAADWAGRLFNSVWKPLALISLRWPIKAMMDEAYGVANLVGALPMMSEIAKSAGNVFFNKGIVRPRELVKGRWVNTASFDEDSLRAKYDEADPFDHRMASNPTAAVPYEAGQFHKVDRKRYDALNRTVGERLDHYDRLDLVDSSASVADSAISKSMGNAVRTSAPRGKQSWEQQWDDRLAAAEQSESRGFFFDPASNKPHNKGFAVSVYPGRLKTFEERPTGRDLHRWLRTNSDLLAIPSNRVGVWLDKETNRWHLDVVRTQAKRESAMLLASEANAGEFFDIGGGFTRYMRDEDPYQHYSSPFVQEGDVAKGLRQAGAREAARADVTDANGVSGEKRAGFGTRKWKGPDGQTIEDEAVFGQNFENKNILFSLTSSKNYVNALYGGHTIGLDLRRRAHNPGKRSVEPGSGRATDAATHEWKATWANEMNRHFRNDPVWRRMLSGESDEQIINYLWSGEGRKMIRQRILVANPREYVQDMRSQFDHLLPTEESRLLVRERDVTPDDADAVIPHPLRESFRGDDLRTADRSQQTSLWREFVEFAYEKLSSGPSDALVRHPFANLVYDMRLKNYYASLPKGTEITVEVQNAARASARSFALKQVRRMLYNIAEENNAAHMLRFVSPFYQAQLEVMQRYTHIFTEHPEALARTLFLFNQSQTDNAFWHTVDQEGNPANGKYDKNNMVLIQIKPWMRSLVNQVPGLKGALDDMGALPVPSRSLDLMFQGTIPIKPEAGPVVAYPAYELYFKNHPADDQSAIYKWLYGFGIPRGDNPLKRAGSAMLPAYLKRLQVAMTDDQSDSGYANMIGAIMAEKTLAFEKSNGRSPTQGEIDQMANAAMGEAKGFYILRAIVSFGSPLPIRGQVKHQYYIDQARKYKAKYGVGWDKKFFDDYGPEFFRFAVSGSKTNNGAAPTTGFAKGYKELKPLIDLAPELAGLIVGPDGADGEFSSGVYQWQLNTRIGPGSKKTMREIPDARSQVENQQIETGWQMWGQLQAGVDAELRAKGLTNIMQVEARDIYINMQRSKRKIIEMNPAWESALKSRDENLPNLIHHMGSIAFSPRLDGRPDIMGLRAYLLSRKEMQKVLIARQETGQATTASLYWSKDPNTGDRVPAGQNAPLAAAWQNYTRELVSRNPAFAEIYHRYLESDDLSAIGGY